MKINSRVLRISLHVSFGLIPHNHLKLLVIAVVFVRLRCRFSMVQIPAVCYRLYYSVFQYGIAVHATSEGLWQEVGEEKLRRCASLISPGFTRTNFADDVTNQEIKAQLTASEDKFAMPPEAVARTVAYVIGQPDDVGVAEIAMRSTAQA